MTSLTPISLEGEATRTAPLAHTQRNLWFIQQMAPASPVYNASQAWRLEGDLDVTALRGAVQSLLGRHEVLRARVKLIDGEPVQWAPSELPDVMEYVDLQGQGISDENQAIEARIIEETRKIIDLNEGPVFRTLLLQLRRSRFAFVMVIHHGFSDGWSMAVLARDLSEFYNASVGRRAPELPAMQISFFEYARAQMSDTRPSVSSDLDYWRRTLEGVPSLLDLPTDYPRPVMQSFRGRRLVFEVGATALRELKAFAREHRVTLNMLLLSVYKLLLYRFSGQRDICVGTPFANRAVPELEDLVGLLVNTLVIRSRIQAGWSFAELLQGVRSRMLEAFNHASVPFEQILEQLMVPRSPGYNPLFQVMFVFQNTPARVFELDSLSIENLTPAGLMPGIGVSKFDLTLTVTERQDTLSCVLDYDSDLFLGETAESLSEAFVCLLDAVRTTPQLALDRLPIMDRSERRRILFELNQTEEEFSSGVSIQECFSKQVERVPDSVALIDASVSLSFRQLDQWSSRIAAVLREFGLESGNVVAIMGWPSADWIAALLAVLRGGYIALPLEPALPTPRVKWFVKNSGARAVLVPPEFHAAQADPGVDVLSIPAVPEHPGTEGAFAPAVAPGAERDTVAYIMFTSGSTGSPRAVAGTHRGILNRCGWMAREYPYGEHETCCHHISPTFVDVFAEVFAPLLAGVPLSVVGHDTRSDPAALVTELGRLGVTRITLTPTMLKAMLDTPDGVRNLDRLGLWICSGEPLGRDLCRRFVAQRPGATLLNVYGSTEVGADATYLDCSRLGTGERVSVGRPLANVKTYVLDPLMEPLPVGFRGELHVGGAGIARGYWRDSTATEMCFVENPFDAGLGRICKTGDLARLRRNGTIEVLGRKDSQIKLHGVRVGVEEIEARLEYHRVVRRAVVGLWETPQGRTFLVAWCEKAPGCSIDPRSLREYLSQYLPRQWIPSYYVSLDLIPRLASGKVDRMALPSPVTGITAGLPRAPLPTDNVERTMHSIWCDILKCEIEDPDADFFDLGGHSLLVFELLERIESAFGVRLQVSAVFLAPTIPELAARIRQMSSAIQPGVLIKVRDGSGSPLVCVPAAATSVLSLRSLASRFAEDQSLYGTEPYGLIPGTEAQSSIEEMAKSYIEALRCRQPAGPYYIAGKCFGGVVAFEMARQLGDSGDCVALLALLETSVPLRNLDRILVALSPSERRRLETLCPPGHTRLASAQTNIDADFERTLSTMSAAVRRMIRAVHSAHRQALSNYVPVPIEAPVTVFRSRQGRWEERVGWDLFTRAGYYCQEFEGNQESMFQVPRVHKLSQALSAAMKTAACATR